MQLTIDRVELTNFRQFYGTQIIPLAPAPGRPLTVIEGPSASGKSTIAGAILDVLCPEANVQPWHCRLNMLEEDGPAAVRVHATAGRAARVPPWLARVFLDDTARLRLLDDPSPATSHLDAAALRALPGLVEEMEARLGLGEDRDALGPRTLASLALAWAISRVCGHGLPFVFDEPLACLDLAARAAVAEHILGTGAHQVIEIGRAHV